MTGKQMKIFYLMFGSYSVGVLAEMINPPGWQWSMFALGLGILVVLYVVAKKAGV